MPIYRYNTAPTGKWEVSTDLLRLATACSEGCHLSVQNFFRKSFCWRVTSLCVCLLPQSAWVQCLLNTRYKVSGFFMKVGPVSKGFASTRGSHRWVEVLFRVYFCPVSPSASSFFFCLLLVITRAFTNEFPACTHSSQYLLAGEPVTRYKWIPYWSDITGCIKIDDYYSGMLV